MRDNDLPDLLHPAPFLYGIRTPDGDAWQDIYCVDRDREALERGRVAALNRDAESDEGLYEVVPLYTAGQVAAMMAARGLSRIRDGMDAPGHDIFTVETAVSGRVSPELAEAVISNCATRFQLPTPGTVQGSTAFTRQRRYTVLKNADLHALALAGQLRPEDNEVLSRLSEAADRIRAANGRPPLRCLVVESDWPEYETTYAAIEKRTGAGHE